MVHFSISLLWRRKIGREKECKCRFSFILNIVFGKKWHLNPISIVKVNFSSLSLRLYCNIFRECRFSLINRRCIETEFYEADLGLFRTCSLILLWKRVKKKKKKSVDWFIIHTEEGRGEKKNVGYCVQPRCIHTFLCIITRWPWVISYWLWITWPFPPRNWRHWTECHPRQDRYIYVSGFKSRCIAQWAAGLKWAENGVTSVDVREWTTRECNSRVSRPMTDRSGCARQRHQSINVIRIGLILPHQHRFIRTRLDLMTALLMNELYSSWILWEVVNYEYQLVAVLGGWWELRDVDDFIDRKKMMNPLLMTSALNLYWPLQRLFLPSMFINV